MELKMKALNKYEQARIIGARALQISLGAPVLIKIPKSVVNPLEISRMELAKDAIPIVVKSA